MAEPKMAKCKTWAIFEHWGGQKGEWQAEKARAWSRKVRELKVSQQTRHIDLTSHNVYFTTNAYPDKATHSYLPEGELRPEVR